MPRFAILEHTGAPDDPAGRHFDLLIEAGDSCRTWRLAALPEPGGPPVAAVELPAHRLAWLDHEAGHVSGGRGFARRLAAGAYRTHSAAGAGADGADGLAIGGVVAGCTLLLTRAAAGWSVAAERSLP